MQIPIWARLTHCLWAETIVVIKTQSSADSIRSKTTWMLIWPYHTFIVTCILSSIYVISLLWMSKGKSLLILHKRKTGHDRYRSASFQDGRSDGTRQVLATNTWIPKYILPFVWHHVESLYLCEWSYWMGKVQQKWPHQAESDEEGENGLIKWAFRDAGLSVKTEMITRLYIAVRERRQLIQNWWGRFMRMLVREDASTLIDQGH